MSSSVDTLNQADALLAPMEITAAQVQAAERFIRARSDGLGDQKMLTQMLGLDAAPEPKRFHAAHRRAVPDEFRRKTAGRRS